MLQGPKPAARLLRDEPEGTEYDYEDRINFAVGICTRDALPVDMLRMHSL